MSILTCMVKCWAFENWFQPCPVLVNGRQDELTMSCMGIHCCYGIIVMHAKDAIPVVRYMLNGCDSSKGG